MYRFYILLFLSYLGSCTNKKSKTNVNDSIPLCRSIATSSGIDSLAMPIKRQNIGNSHLLISTKNTEAQIWFDQGLNLLHGFWHLEAYRSFKQVIQLDSSCAMAYWGLAMCQPGFGNTDSRWVDAINKAVSLKATASPFEQDLITASQILLTRGVDASFQDFRKLSKTYSSEPEAIAFAGIMMRQSNNDMNGEVGNEIKVMLETAMKRFPTHVGLLHYYIHLMELRPDFRKAIPSSSLMVSLTKMSPHLQHMPGHLAYLSGNYSQAIKAYQTTRSLEERYHSTEKIPFIYNQNYIHNLQFLAVAQAENNDYKDAINTANVLANMSPNASITNQGATMMFLYEGMILPALVNIRFRQWQKAIDYLTVLLNKPQGNNLATTYFMVMKLYCEGMKSINDKDVNTATLAGTQLSQLMTQFEQQGAVYQNTPEFKSINETFDIMSMARYELAGWIDNIDTQKPFNRAAWDEAINLEKLIHYDEPPRLMYPIEESLARLHKLRGETKLLITAKNQALKRRPNSKIIQSI